MKKLLLAALFLLAAPSFALAITDTTGTGSVTFGMTWGELPPTQITTNSASSVSQYTATLNGLVVPNGANTDAWFEWGTTASFGNSTPSANYGTTATSYSSMLGNLSANTTYYYRAVARNFQGTVYGSMLPFTTLGVPSGVTVNTTITSAPTVSSIGPSSATVGSTVHVYGSNYNRNTFIALDGAYGQTLTPTLISPTSLSFVVPSSLSIGSHTVAVNEKAAAFPLSSSVTLNVVATPQTPIVSSPNSSQGTGSVTFGLRWEHPPTQTISASGADIDISGQASSCVNLSNNMRYRMRDTSVNNEVSDLQDFLNLKGFLKSEPTGFFGLATLKAVKAYQSSIGLSPTGYVGPLTRSKINAETCLVGA